MRPHRQQPTRLTHPWDSPGKNTGVGCHFLLQCMKVKSESEVAQSCLTLSDPMDCSPPGSSIHGIFQARVLEWDAIAFSTHHQSRYPLLLSDKHQLMRIGELSQFLMSGEALHLIGCFHVHFIFLFYFIFFTSNSLYFFFNFLFSRCFTLQYCIGPCIF